MSDEFSSNSLEKLDQFINSNPEPRELKRALAVQMLTQGVKRKKIQEILGVSAPFISKWKVRYAWEGLEGLKLKHRGSRGYLSKRDRIFDSVSGAQSR
ncbi:helix-turn-helix domain-containing protein [Euhalothece natronophila]|uniref:helix-turn-helix domain-containing protein n=1 Tax=Euhalothece natronophila TaxID=577489 RepID=UPI001C98FBD9|nr:helix-turn-helix domain-containing protein [Euhalothece natronophila]